MNLQLSHFSSAVLFGLFASVVFGITQRSTSREQIRYGLYCFAMFVGGVFVAGWAMWLLRRLAQLSVFSSCDLLMRFSAYFFRSFKYLLCCVCAGSSGQSCTQDVCR